MFVSEEIELLHDVKGRKEKERKRQRTSERMSAHDKIRVVVRIRPRERADSPSVWQYDQQRMTLSRAGTGPGTTAFAYDHVFGEAATNADVYKGFAQPIALSVLNGINGLLLSLFFFLTQTVCVGGGR